MTLFNPVDMMGPAHRGGQIQKLAQNAAANVMRRQKMRALIQQGARGVAAGSGGGVHTGGSLRAHPTGVRGAVQAGAGSLHANTLAQMMLDAGQRAQTPGSDDGQYGQGGGGYDFASLPDPSDPAQAPGSLGPDAVTAPPLPPEARTPGSTTTGGETLTPTSDTGVAASDPTYGGQVQDLQSGVTGLIHLGGGMYYDPATDSVRGGGALEQQTATRRV